MKDMQYVFLVNDLSWVRQCQIPSGNKGPGQAKLFRHYPGTPALMRGLDFANTQNEARSIGTGLDD